MEHDWGRGEGEGEEGRGREEKGEKEGGERKEKSRIRMNMSSIYYVYNYTQASPHRLARRDGPIVRHHDRDWY